MEKQTSFAKLSLDWKEQGALWIGWHQVAPVNTKTCSLLLCWLTKISFNRWLLPCWSCWYNCTEATTTCIATTHHETW